MRTLSSGTATVVSLVIAVTLLAALDKNVPQILETIVVLVLGAGTGAAAGYGVGKAETAKNGGTKHE